MKSNLFPQMPPGVPAESQIRIFNLSDALAEFRAQLEREGGLPLEQIDVPVAFVLSDLCEFLGFGPALRVKIMGRSAAEFVDFFLGASEVA